MRYTLSWKCRECVHISICRLFMLLSIFLQLKYFFALKLNSTSCILFHSLQTKSRKRLAHDMIDTCVTHAGLVHHIKDPDCQAQLAALMAWLLQFFFFFFNNLDKNSTEKPMYDSKLLYYLTIESVSYTQLTLPTN